MKIEFHNRAKKSVPKKYLQEFLDFAWRKLKSKKVIGGKLPKHLIVVFVGKKEGRSLNKQFRAKDYATDVLSFGGLDHESLGELVFCTPVLEKQAKEHGLSYRDECAYMLLHGVLHLLGFEHEEDQKEAKRMFDLQDSLFEAWLK